MSADRPAHIGFNSNDVDQDAPATRRRHSPSQGRRRMGLAVALLLVVSAGLAIIGPLALSSPDHRHAILPGLTIEDAGSRKGVVVTSVQSNSIADDAGIEVGDRIVALDETKITSRAEARRYLDRKRPVVVDMKLVRRNQPMDVIYAFPRRGGS